ncbi:MAG: transketolase C-terminal domain-containing protein [Thermoplasmata archaeon]
MPMEVMTGNSAQAYGAKLARAEVVAAYPITPQTTLVEKIADLVASGEMKSQYIKVESEHSAMAACIAASATGARAYTATSAHGLALMHEMLIWAAGSRLPIVMGNINRAMAPPWSVWSDYQDSIAQRDTGWMQFYCQNNQEVLDTVIQAYKVAENHDILLPAMIMEDAFYLSHTFEPVDVPPQEDVDTFLPSYNPPVKLDVDDPVGMCALVPPDHYMEFRFKVAKAMEASRDVIREVDEEWNKKFGRSHGGLVERYRMDDADAAIVAAGTISSTARVAVDKMRDEGKKVGLARLRVFRPFPHEEMRQLAKEVDSIGVLDRSYTFGHGAAFYAETASALYRTPERPLVKNYVVGIGGRDVPPKDLEEILEKVLNKEDGAEVEWWGLRTRGSREVD